jgi:hypothetical protein
MFSSSTCRRSLLPVLSVLLTVAAIAPAQSAAARRGAADESLEVPVAVTGPAVGTGGESAALSGSVYPRGTPTSYHFEYGPTTFYGDTTPAAIAGSEMTTVAVAATLGGLRSGWAYHYRLVAANTGGIATGFDRTVTTWSVIAPPAITPPPATPAPTMTFAGVRLVSSRLTVARGSIIVMLSCPADAAGRCSGRTELTTRRRRAAARTSSTVLLGQSRFSVGAGQRATVRVRLAREGRRLLRRVGRLSGRDTNTARDGDGDGVAKSTVARVTIRRPAR